MICTRGRLLNSVIRCTWPSVKWFFFSLPFPNKFIVYWRTLVSYGSKKNKLFFKRHFFSHNKKIVFLLFFFFELKSFKLKCLVRHLLKPFQTSHKSFFLCTPETTNCNSLPLAHISKTNCILLQSFQEFHNCFPRLLRCCMRLYLKERERYLCSASTSNSLAAWAAAPEARVVNSISCMFIVVAPNILQPLFFLRCRCSSTAS